MFVDWWKLLDIDLVSYLKIWLRTSGLVSDGIRHTSFTLRFFFL